MHIQPTLLIALAAAALAGCASSTNSHLSADGTVHLSSETGPLRIAVVRMVHGHVAGLLNEAARNPDIKIVGIYEPDKTLFDRYARRYRLSDSLWYGDLGKMLDSVKPEAVSVMTSVKDHRMAVEACAPRGVHCLLEKPLAFSNDDARAMSDLARKYGVLVLTNFETSWYGSTREAKTIVDSGQLSPIRKMVFRTGHRGPIEIGCGPEFVQWLTDPVENGGGALVDFGCYGAITATWMMGGQRPIHVSASAATLKPGKYPKVDDDATIVLTYPTATAVLQASWCWTHDNKDMDVFTEKGSIQCGKGDNITVRDPDRPARPVTPAPRPPELRNTWAYLQAVVRGKCAVDPLSSMELNLIAVEILDAARADVARSAPPALSGPSADARN